MKTSADRRTGARLDVVGPLWGTVHFNVPVRIVDASALGVLIASPVRFPAESIQQLCINVGGPRIQGRRARVSREGS
jgi:hypothetical protein